MHNATRIRDSARRREFGSNWTEPAEALDVADVSVAHDPEAAPALDGAAYVERQRGPLRLDGPLGGSAIGVLDGAGKPDERLGKSEARHDGEPKHLCSKSSALGHWNLSPVRRIPTPSIGWT